MWSKLSIVRNPARKNHSPITAIVLLLALMLIHSGSVGYGGFDDDEEVSQDISGIYWPMIGRDNKHTSFGSGAVKGLLDPVVSWTGNTTSLASVGADFTNNIVFNGVPATEVFGIVESNNTHIRIREGDSGVVIWQVDVRKIEGRTTNRLRMSPALADMDADGKVEVLLYVWDLNQFQLALYEPVTTRNATGYHWSTTAYYDERIWLSINVPSVVDPQSSPVLHDVSGDGVEDVLVGSGNSLASFFGNNGTIMWMHPVGQPGEMLSTPAIYPGTGGVRRIAVNSLTATRQNLRTTLVNFNGTHLMNISVPLGSTVPYQYAGRITMPVIGDVTGTGQPEILVSYPSRFGEGRITIYSYMLEALAEIDTITGLLESTPSVADADGDGDLEIFVHSRYYTTGSWMNMSCYDIVPIGPDLTVNVRWWRDGVNVGTSPLYTSPLLCDLDGDDAPDAVFFANDWVHAVSFSGTILWSLPISHPQFGFQGVIGDLGRDEFTDIFFDGIMISQKVIDLAISQPISESIYPGDEPVNGLEIPLHCIVENLGTSPAREVLVLFEATPPGGGKGVVGSVILEEVVNTHEATVLWTPEGVGNHRIDVTIDPNGTVIETNEENNDGWTEIPVREAIPDLVVHDIKFVRGDGLVLTGENSDKRLVGGDPSSVLVQVMNIGEGPSFVGLLDIYMNGSSPGEQGSDVPIGTVLPGSVSNISIPWTPDELPEGVMERSYNVSAVIDTDTQGMEELDKFNNDGYNISNVKSRSPIGGFEINGRVLNSEGQGEADVRITATNRRTLTVLEDESNFQGDYSIYYPQTDYLDGDVIDIYARRSTSWAQNLTRIYSEDGSGNVALELTDVPTTAIAMIPEGQLEYEVLPRVEYNLRFWVENTGNIPGEASLERSVSGNTSLVSSQVYLSPTDLSLQASERKEVLIRFTVPPDEEPGRVIFLRIDGSITGNGTAYSSLDYTFTVGRSGLIYYEFDSERNVTLDANKEDRASFRVYILNQGNIPVDYNLTASSTLLLYSLIERGEGTLDPSRSAQVDITITMPPSEDRLVGDIELRTSGSPKMVSWEVRIETKYPDLEADEIIRMADPNPVLGDMITLLGTVSNRGDIDAGAIVCAFYEEGELIASSTIDSLGPGEEATAPGVVWQPSGTGEREVSFVIDPVNALLEKDEDNNEAYRTFSFFPDISILSADLQPGTAPEGGQVKASVVVKNTGNARIDRGFELTIRNGGSQGDLLASQEYDEDVSAGGIDTVSVELIFNAPRDIEGTADIWLGVSIVGSEERVKENNDVVRQLQIENPPNEKGGNYLFWIIGIGIAVLVVGAGLYIWRFGLPISPPPGGAEKEQSEEEEAVVEAIGPGSSVDEADLEGVTPIEMHLEDPLAEDLAATVTLDEPIEVEVVEVEAIDESTTSGALSPGSMEDEEEEGLIPEV
ncbi:MAG: hypothetical protein JW939_05025 [Candidatus Thermoplasmatota archaeon]|nr:hypothetical protein [Candidatus Thermoplasmatota archaeon]